MNKFKLHYGNDSISFINYNDHPDLPKEEYGQNYVRKYKKHISIMFVNTMNDGSIVEDYKDKVNAYENYFKKLGIDYKISSSVHKTYGSESTLIKVGLENVDIIEQ
jgi:hypothetical protein